MIETAAMELSPGMARDLGADPPRTPSFLNWAARETERLEQLARHTEDRTQRFEIQNRIAGVVGAAFGYGQWLWETAG